MSHEDHDKESAKLGFDITKQFLTLAVGGIAFVVGLTYSKPGSVSSLLFWIIVVMFALSAVFGLLFLMHGVSTMSVSKSYDIYSTSLRLFAGLQIVLVLLGMVLMAPILSSRPSSVSPESPARQIKIETGHNQSITYPLESDKSYTIEIDSGKVKFTATK